MPRTAKSGRPVSSRSGRAGGRFPSGTCRPRGRSGRRGLGQPVGAVEDAGLVAAGDEERRPARRGARSRAAAPAARARRAARRASGRRDRTAARSRRPTTIAGPVASCLDRQQPARAHVDVAAHLARGEGLEARGAGGADDRDGLQSREPSARPRRPARGRLRRMSSGENRAGGCVHREPPGAIVPTYAWNVVPSSQGIERGKHGHRRATEASQ